MNIQGFAVIKLEGNFNIDAIPEFKKTIKNYLDSDTIIFDFRHVTHISSSALRELNGVRRKVINKGNSVKIVNMSPDVLETFNMTGYSKFFVIE